MTHSPRLLAGDVRSMPLNHTPSDDVVSGSPTEATHTLGAVGDTEVGVWEITEGTVRDTEVDEVFVVLSGAGQVEFADGETIDLSPGVAVLLREGERTTWTITQTLRKVWVA